MHPSAPRGRLSFVRLQLERLRRMYRFDALILDVDGTLADTERDGHRPAFNAAFAEAGLDWHWSTDLYGQRLAVTGGKERIRFFIENTFPELGESAEHRRVYGAG